MGSGGAVRNAGGTAPGGWIEEGGTAMDAKASVVTRRGMQYPNGDDFFSPSERFPEYPFDTISKRENPVYRLVRQALADAGLDRRRFGSSSWNPLGGYMRPAAVRSYFATSCTTGGRWNRYGIFRPNASTDPYFAR